ncbi:MAG: molybdate ABC transporter substrate-binding protein [Candidatus Omnitrophica bacterium]|nr:molybdate ABC transporter substrate-binding protein [Candidatus Omnitrophota bacterium]
MRKLSLILFLIFTFPLNSSADITVAVAANVQYPFEELKSIFEKETGIAIRPVFGSSGKFTTLIKNGAPFDIFISADMDYPLSLDLEGYTYNTPQIYAYGYLVLWTMDNIDLSRGIEILTLPDIKKIAIAFPKTAPYGRQAVNALEYYNLYTQVEKKLVYGENTAQTNQFITTKAVDVGITSKSAVLAPNMEGQGKWIEIDKNSYEPIAQGAVIPKYAEKKNLVEAKMFLDFLLSEEAGNIFKKYGYTLPIKE